VITTQRSRDTDLTRVTDNHPVRDILIVGLGSIGRRHLANLRALGWPHVRLYRCVGTTQSDAELAGLSVDHDLPTALSRRPLAVVVSNPSALHVPLALDAARAGSHLLIEKPLSDDLDGVTDLESLVADRGLIALLGFQFRFNPGLRQIRTWLRAGAIGTVVSAQVHWGEYLPDTHPWEDYRAGYAARAELGGGVLLTLSHPFDYLRWLLGEIEHVSAVESWCNPLGLSVDTCVDVTARFASGASAHLHLNFVERPPNHQLRVIGTEGSITWNDADSAARRYCVSSRRWETVPAPDGFERNWMFRDEMRHFLACLHGEERPLSTISDGRAALELALAARRVIMGARIAARSS
jgi:predicted dehydrogenase